MYMVSIQEGHLYNNSNPHPHTVEVPRPVSISMKDSHCQVVLTVLAIQVK